ncbi:hypothetical protein JX265_011095 [Neoarthrinium moseri]|uniref:Uncharacterized protein n=1 Tax=Neoarthrinium moseri TaxID=1658444 RepID=A0A9P9WD84_9PEZI|nr:uncharacterized protein JN550_005076 [Neoarthrinium moseri]KAI1852461.1 hypothetical protein JX266_002639 [Neoarthrinium moseri]KAI1857680.1 hypothetical protein JX265_011095 [Neoarthrinium moseri]KAI1870533.1 hypothetical protein JN550_005076 [Neoarthrinium moseri]
MKTSFVLALLPLLAFANPVPEAKPEPKPEVEGAQIEKRATTCALTGSDVKYRQRPTTDSPADGQFGAKGTEVSFSCWTTGETINGNNLWNKIASGTGKGDYVTDYYITRACSAKILTKC